MLAESHIRPEFFYVLLATAAVGLITVKPLAALGRKSILGWIDEQRAAILARLPLVAWIAAPLLAVVLCVVMLPQSSQKSVHDLTAMSVLIGILAALLTNLTRIDALCRLLPDPLTGLLAASGITAHALGLPPAGISLTDALIGSILGYGLLWLVAWLFQKFRAKEAMGRGDFAMSAGLGAWLGWQSIPMVWMIASLAGILFAFLGKWQPQSNDVQRTREPLLPRPFMNTEIPFGPALALGAIATWVQLG